LTAGGQPPTATNAETWNGSAWTEVADLNTARFGLAGAGTGPSNLAISGITPGGASTNTESWNGSAWTEVGTLNSGRYGYLAAAGNVSLALAFGGGGANAPASYALTESWDGSTWTELADMSTARGELSGARSGTSSLTLAAGGGTPSPGYSSLTEEWTAPDIVINTLTTS
jgi:hypothetical protein